MADSTITREMIEAAAAAIANNRAARGHGAPAIRNVLTILPQKLKDQVLEDAEDALKAALSVALTADCMWDDATRIAINTEAEARIAKLEASLPLAISRHLSTICSHLLGLHDASADPKVRELAVAIRANTAEAGEAFAAALATRADRSADVAASVPVPAPGTEERDFWLEAAEQHGIKSVEASDFIQQTLHHYYAAGEQAVLELMAAAREQGRKDMLTASFQARVQPWMMACFGEMIAGDREERNHRFLEEALELVQACGCTADEAHQLVEYVYGRPVGEKGQEVGGVMVTLAALCLAQELDLHREAEIELARIWPKVEQIRAKQAAKPKYSPLPELVLPTTPPGGDR